MTKIVIKRTLLAVWVFVSFVMIAGAQQNNGDNQAGTADTKKEKASKTVLTPYVEKGILKLGSTDKKYKFWFDNRVFLDGSIFSSALNKVGNGVGIRRLRFAVKTQLHGKWLGELDIDFAGASIAIKDAYIKYKIKDGYIKGGNYKEPFSMETLTSSRYTLFMERSLVSKFAPSRYMGISAAKWGANWSLAAGMFFNKVEKSKYVHNTQTLNEKYGIDEGISFTGRMIFNPVIRKNKIIHLGIGASYRTPETSTGEPYTYRFSTRSMSFVNRKKYIDTGVIPDVDHKILLGYEFAAALDNIMLQAEYITNTVYGKNDKYEAKFAGGYIQAGWLIFGSKYNYDHKGGKFGNIIQNDSRGEIQLAVMYGFVNATDEKAGIYGGAGNSYSIGLTYFLNANIRFKLDYNYINHDKYANGNGKLYIYEDAQGNKYTDPEGLNVDDSQLGDDIKFISFRAEMDF